MSTLCTFGLGPRVMQALQIDRTIEHFILIYFQILEIYGQQVRYPIYHRGMA